jgi:hypothetical protein
VISETVYRLDSWKISNERGRDGPSRAGSWLPGYGNYGRAGYQIWVARPAFQTERLGSEGEFGGVGHSSNADIFWKKIRHQKKSSPSSVHKNKNESAKN